MEGGWLRTRCAAMREGALRGGACRYTCSGACDEDTSAAAFAEEPQRTHSATVLGASGA